MAPDHSSTSLNQTDLVSINHVPVPGGGSSGVPGVRVGSGVRFRSLSYPVSAVAVRA